MIKLVKTSVFVGPNPFAGCRALRVLLDLGDRADRTLEALEVPADAFAAVEELGDWARDGSAAGLTVGEVLARLGLELQRMAGLEPPAFASSRPWKGLTEVVHGFAFDGVATEAAQFAREWLRHLLRTEDGDPEFDAEEELSSFARRVRRLVPGPSTLALLRAAEQRDIPWMPLADGGLIQFGQGCRQRRIDASTTSLTPHLSVGLAGDRRRLHALLAEAGLPQPERRIVDEAEEAERAAAEIGYPVVVKPVRPTAGRGVTLNIMDVDALAEAFADAADHDDDVIVERHIPGRRHRLLVVGSRLVAALRADPPPGAPDDGLTEGDVTDAVHPEVRGLAVRAARIVGLDIAAVEYVTTDIGAGPYETGGAVCAVDAGPSLRPFLDLPGRDAAGAVLDFLFPPGVPARIPIAAITGTNGKTTTTRMLAAIMAASGKQVGLTSTDAVYLDGLPAVRGDMSGPTAARTVLRDPLAEVAVLETARGGIVRRGLGFDRCDVATVLNVTPDHLGMDGIDTLADLAHIKATLVRVTAGTVVLNADDPESLAMRTGQGAARICLVSADPANPVVREHVAAGNPGAVLDTDDGATWIVLLDGAGGRRPVIAADHIPATLGGRARHNVHNAMVAAAMADALGCPADAIAAGLARFSMSFDQAPGRMNIHDGHGFRVILDYGHNPAALRAMVDTVEAMAPAGRRIVVIMVPGDRRDSDVDDIAAALAGHFDHYICKQNDDLRGRADGEITALARARLLARGVPDAAVSMIPDEVTAVDAALRMAGPEDLVLIFGERTTRCWRQIVTFSGTAAANAGQT